MLTLYHYDRSTAAQRVRLGLDEKKIKWNSVIVDTAMGDASKRPDGFHKLNPISNDNFVLNNQKLKNKINIKITKKDLLKYCYSM